ncbi:hypothetical protein K2173_004874 [Erythroxylum novogranatense]|uniref:HMG box domain-containing protein n=1 Tax=Erythroxylum novogranatense TaxID=1862640 RepID=A0AAV8TB15_9ROSI|nr:hypothetical protein K2173_004874 [Erythroxylum novogranatense]
MANPPRTRRRIHALRRAPDGSAFQKCNNCGVMVPIALADMHDCEAATRKDVKRFKGLRGNHNVVKLDSPDQPRSPFRFFMEDFMKKCKSRNSVGIDRLGFEIWKNMPDEKRQPYVVEADKVNSAYARILIQEAYDYTSKVVDEAGSATAGDFDKFYEDDGLETEPVESFDSWEKYIVSATDH